MFSFHEKSYSFVAGFTVFVLEICSAMFNKKPDYFLKALKSRFKKTLVICKEIFFQRNFFGVLLCRVSTMSLCTTSTTLTTCPGGVEETRWRNSRSNPSATKRKNSQPLNPSFLSLPGRDAHLQGTSNRPCVILS